MKMTFAGSRGAMVPRRRQKHYSYNETLDESAKLIADEPVEIEQEAPAEENDSVEGTKADNSVESPAFEE